MPVTVYRPAPSQRAEPHCQPCFFPVLQAVLTAELYQYAFPTGLSRRCKLPPTFLCDH